MKNIHLTQGQIALIDDDDFEYLNQWKWYASWNPNTCSFYATRHISAKENQIRMHRVIMNTPNELDCDHIDHNTLNNQKHNLRNCAPSQNASNRNRPNKNNTTGILGIIRKGKGFRAQINKNGKRVNLPTRNTIEDAIEDRKNAVEGIYGEFGS